MSEKKFTPLNGGFIQFWDEPEMFEDYTWKSVIGEMNELNMEIVIIQFMQKTDKNGDVHLFLPQNDDDEASPAGAIFKYAKIHGMKVFLGIYNGPLSGDPLLSQPKNLNDSKDKNVTLAKRLFKLYKNKEAFYGWYIPSESWTGDYTAADVKNWNNFYTELGAELEKIAPTKKILISPFISESRALPEKTEENYRRILSNTKIDFVALQDGIGAGYATLNDLNPYFEAMKNACTANNIELWGNIESYETINGKRLPTNIDKFKQQNIEVSKHVKNIITFDFFHYMNSKIQLKGTIWNSDYISRIQKLNKEYRLLQAS